ncbi:MAG: MFS transporter [Verrucomicrobia bacterium]|nr:MFS transporter [Verrucomicrobiota bacterium]
MLTREWKYLLLITVTFIAACIETDIYLPTFTDMMSYFSISEREIQGLLTWNFIGICIAGPLYGPVSDAIGRKKPLLFALGLFFAGSVITMYAEDFTWMLVGRVLQGLGSGGCFTLGTAIIFDAFKQEEAIVAIGRLNSIVPIIMAMAPILGGYLNCMYGFRSNFLAIALVVLASLLICLLYLEETLPTERRAPFKLNEVMANFRKVLTSVPFWQTTCVVSLVFAGYLAFLSAISVLFVIEFGVSKAYLPYFQASLLGAWVAASLGYKRAIACFGKKSIKRAGTVLFLLGGAGFIATSYYAAENPYLLTLPMLFYSFGANWVQGLYFPEGMEIFPDIKGIAASVLTSARLLITACVVGVASHFYDATIYPVMMVILAIVLVVYRTIASYEKRKRVTVCDT